MLLYIFFWCINDQPYLQGTHYRLTYFLHLTPSLLHVKIKGDTYKGNANGSNNTSVIKFYKVSSAIIVRDGVGEQIFPTFSVFRWLFLCDG